MNEEEEMLYIHKHKHNHKSCYLEAIKKVVLEVRGVEKLGLKFYSSSAKKKIIVLIEK